MKRLKTILSVVVLTLMFVGAANVTKASAADYTLKFSGAGANVHMYYLNGQASKETLHSGNSVPEGTVVTAEVKLEEGMGSYTVSGITTKTLDGSGFTFVMPAEAVSITVTARPSEKIDAEVDYSDETIKVTCGVQVYYQVVKSKQPGTLKEANWVTAAYDTENKVYCIDYSSVANGKDAYFALTVNKEAVEADEVAIVDSVVKSVKVGLNYRAEEIKNGLSDVIASLNVKGVEGSDDNADGTAAEYNLKWKRGANGKWAVANEFDQLQWDMLKASNSTLYVAIDGKAATEDSGAKTFRLSKEAKVKIPKSAKAPTVKVDYVKSTIALKNGMQFRLVQESGVSEWITIAAYDRESEAEEVFSMDATAKTSSKVAAITVQKLVDTIADAKLLNTKLTAGKEYEFEVRTAATDKKFSSMIRAMKLVLPKSAPAMVASTNITYIKANRELDVEAEFVIDFKLIQSAGISTEELSEYEYILADKAEDKVDFTKQKWTKVPEGGKLDLSSKIGKTYTCMLEDGTKLDVKYEDTSVIYFRRAAVKPDIKNGVEGVFAGNYAAAGVVITEKVAEAKKYAMIAVTDSVDAVVTMKINGTEVASDEMFATEKAAITFTYKPSADTKEADSVKISYQEEGGTPQNVELTAEGDTYSFTMPAADVTITVIEKNKSTS